MKSNFYIITFLLLLCSITMRVHAQIEVHSGTAGNLTWRITNDGVLTISGNDVMPDYNSMNTPPWYDYREEIERVTIEAGVLSISNSAFYRCLNLLRIDIPESVRSIGSSSFSSLTIGGIIQVEWDVPIDLSEEFNYSSAYRLIVPYGTKSLYAATATWGNFMIMENDPLNPCIPLAWGTCGAEGDGSNLTWELSCDSVLYIKGTGAMENYGGNKTPSWIWNEIWTKTREVVIEEGVTTIGNYAFNIPSYYGVSQITSVVLPIGLKTIGHRAFYDCVNLKSINIPDGITRIEYSTFYNCANLETINIPDGVTTIVDGAFEDCKKLKNVSFPNSVTIIGGGVFKGCSSITQVFIPSSVLEMDYYPFPDCSNLLSIDVADENPRYSSKDGILFDKMQETLIQYPGGKGGTYTVPSGVFYISMCAFQGCRNLESIIIHDAISTIPYYAFSGCASLKSFVIPHGIPSIEQGAFSECASLESISISGSVSSIGVYAFMNCTNLQSVVIPNTVQTIANHAFSGCISLTSVTIGKGIQTIAGGTFSNCSNLPFIVIPDNVQKIESGAFQNCVKLSKVDFGKVETIEQSVFSGCLSLNIVKLPKSIKYIGIAAFFGYEPKIISLSDVPPRIQSFSFVINKAYVPESLLSVYRKSDVWRDFTINPIINTINPIFNWATLDSLEVDGYQLHPAFHPDTMHYSLTVPSANPDSIDIIVRTLFPASVVWGDGVKRINKGANVFEVEVVYSPIVNSAVLMRTYTITVDYGTENSVTMPDYLPLVAYPNPTTEMAYIEIENPEDVLKIEIYNTQGMSVMKLTRNEISSKTSVNLSAFPSGVYFVAVAGKNTTKTVKIVKQ